MNTKKILSLKKIAFEVQNSHHKILDDVDFEVHEEECVMLIGSNGSGKSSLLKIINGLYHPTAGSIEFLGNSLLDLPVRKRAQHIATLNQDVNLSTFSELTVYENYMMAMAKKETPLKKQKNSREIASEYLVRFNPRLPERMDTVTGALSGGERQSLGLGLCMMHHPNLLLLDEHTSALDPSSARRLMEMTAAAVSENKLTAIICTHNLQDALHYGNRLIAMRKGSIILDLKQNKKKSITKEELLKIYGGI